MLEASEGEPGMWLLANPVHSFVEKVHEGLYKRTLYYIFSSADKRTLCKAMSIMKRETMHSNTECHHIK